MTIGDSAHAVSGLSWFDHEWASNQLGPEQVGWDWLCVQLADGRELMLYRMRLRDGQVDPASSGTLIERDGTTVHLDGSDFEMIATRRWKSGRSGAEYPVEWAVRIPSRGIQIRVTPVLDAQELALNPLTYWEGAVDVSGTERGQTLSGRGYLELTGYAAPMRALQR
jgi:predicted secreted hydrolase